jgi:hypothetical protein
LGFCTVISLVKDAVNATTGITTTLPEPAVVCDWAIALAQIASIAIIRRMPYLVFIEYPFIFQIE